MAHRYLALGPALFVLVACSSSGGGGGFVDGGLGGGATGGSGAKGGFGGFGGAGATGGSGATGGFGGFGGAGATGGSGASGATGGSGAVGGFGATGGTGAIGGTGATGGFGGSTQCDQASDCSDPTTMVCDPATAKCVAGQCSDSLTCPTGKTCVNQDDTATVGACYPECIFKGAACAGGATCKVSMADNSGFCWPSGSATVGQTCSATSLNSGCAQGLVCATDNSANVCRDQCSFWAPSTGCPTAQHCALNGVCFAEPGDPATIGGSCASGSTGGEPCGVDASGWRGLCVDLGSGFTCAKACRAAVPSDCTTGTCQPFPTAPDIGVCN